MLIDGAVFAIFLGQTILSSSFFKKWTLEVTINSILQMEPAANFEASIGFMHSSLTEINFRNNDFKIAICIAKHTYFRPLLKVCCHREKSTGTEIQTIGQFQG